LTAIPTTGPSTAQGIARRCIEDGADLIVVAGGDGTVNEALNGILHSEVPLAVLPAGTANVLAAEIGIGTRMMRAAAQLHSWAPHRLAVGRIQNLHQERHFLLMAGAGLDAMIVYSVDAAMKRSFGKVAYWIAGLSQLGKALPEFEVRMNGHEIRCSFALASRVRNYGGDLTIARNASLFNDDFEVVLFKGAHSLPYVKYMLGVITGRLSGMSGVLIDRSKTLELECASGPGVYLQVDGEYAGRLPARLEIVPRAVSLLLPADFHRGHHLPPGSNG
jgi:diacylglycerol kinase family enzyme